jgi:hypothetical protein
VPTWLRLNDVLQPLAHDAVIIRNQYVHAATGLRSRSGR